MKYVDYFNNYLSNALGIKGPFVSLIIYTILCILIVKVVSKLVISLYFKFVKNNKNRFVFGKKVNLISNVLIILFILMIWEKFIVTFITLISFVSAAIAYSLRDTIINFFCGIYIKIAKPFIIEDRIEIDDYIGDVVNITALSFEILEIDKNNFQSTGVIVHIPNSKIFSGSMKNYVKVFKYIWNEIEIKIPIDSDIKMAKGCIYKIVKSNEILKKIPNKMINQLNNTGDYRIYYNKLEPIIYTRVCDKYVSLVVRYLVHPKKNRNIESEIWNEILRLYKLNKFPLYIEK